MITNFTSTKTSSIVICDLYHKELPRDYSTAVVKYIQLVQRRLDSGLQSIMVNERLITRGFSLMR